MYFKILKKKKKNYWKHASDKLPHFMGQIDKLLIGNCVVMYGKIFCRKILGIIKSNLVLFLLCLKTSYSKCVLAVQNLLSPKIEPQT